MNLFEKPMKSDDRDGKRDFSPPDFDRWSLYDDMGGVIFALLEYRSIYATHDHISHVNTISWSSGDIKATADRRRSRHCWSRFSGMVLEDEEEKIRGGLLDEDRLNL